MKNLINKIFLTGMIGAGSLGIFGNNGYGQEIKYFDVFPKEVSGDTIYLPNGYKFEKTKVNDSVAYINALDGSTVWERDSVSSVNHLKNIIGLYEGTMDNDEIYLGGHPIFAVKYVRVVREGEYKGISSMENLNKICKRLTKYNKEESIEERLITKKELKDFDNILYSHYMMKSVVDDRDDE